MGATLLQQIMEVNRKFLAGSPQFLDSTGEPFIVITCMDPRLTGVIEPALGLPKHRAIVIRTAGNAVSDSTHDVLRSVAAGIFMKAGKEIFVVGHTDCALASFSASEVAESFRKAGIPRSAFGDQDLRSWFGAFADVRVNVREAVRYLRESSLMPRNIKIHGLIIGIEKGEVEVVLDGDAAPVELRMQQAEEEEVTKASVPEGAAQAAAAASSPAPPGSIPPMPKGAKGPVVIPVPAKVAKAGQPASLLDAAMILKDFISRERQNARFERTLAKIDTLLRNEKDPVRVIAGLDEIADSYKAKYPELPGALECLKRSVQGKGTAGLSVKDLIRHVFE